MSKYGGFINYIINIIRKAILFGHIIIIIIIFIIIIVKVYILIFIFILICINGG
jgi:hypothetical protein